MTPSHNRTSWVLREQLEVAVAQGAVLAGGVKDTDGPGTTKSRAKQKKSKSKTSGRQPNTDGQVSKKVK